MPDVPSGSTPVPAAATITSMADTREDQLLLALRHGLGAKHGGMEILASGRRKAVIQGIVQVLIVIVRSHLQLSGNAIIWGLFWIGYSGFGFFMFTPRKGTPQYRAVPDHSSILPKLAVYIVLASTLIAVTTSRGFSEIDRLQAIERALERSQHATNNRSVGAAAGERRRSHGAARPARRASRDTHTTRPPSSRGGGGGQARAQGLVPRARELLAW